MRGYLRLSRPGNAVMSAAGVAVAALVSVGPGLFAARAVAVASAGVAALLFTAAGNALNDYFDRDTDKVNHPERPIPRQEVSAESAARFASLMFALSLVAAYYVNLEAVVIVAINFAVIVGYEKLFKARGASGNFLIAYLVGSLFVFGGIAVYAGAIGAMQRAWVLALLAFMATAGREISKDIEDVEGDVDRVTLPRRVGVPKAGRAAAALFLAGVVLSLVPIVLGLFGWPYLVIVLVADGIFIYAGLYSTRYPGRAQRTAKYGMIVALVAFLAGCRLA